MRFCSQCGSEALAEKIPDDDHRPRVVCADCHAIHYFNPKIITGCIPIWPENGNILICKRAIEPRLGFWTVPCGYMENGETVEEGAARETYEEANVRVDIKRLHTIFSIPHINQVYMIFIAHLESLEYNTTPETSELKLIPTDEIPWKDLAFSSVSFALKNYLADLESGNCAAHLGMRSMK